MPLHRPAKVILAGVVALGATRPPLTPAAVPAPAVTPTTAPADDALLPRDPANVYGTLPNGLHYVIRHDADPPGKVSVDLAVRTGSLNETAEQNGLAHFLEHMAFKGSTHFGPMKLIPLLTHLGMRFGADSNAHTNQYETVFKLTMPDAKPETVHLALTIFSDFASGLSLFPLQVESERRVILEEARVRRNAGMRVDRAANDRLYPGSRLAVHDVLGDLDIIRTAPASRLADYWDQWYRPERMTLIVVGDVDPAAVIAQAGPLLGTFAARRPARPAEAAGLEPFTAPQAVVLSDPDQSGVGVQMVCQEPPRPPVTTEAEYRRTVVADLCKGIVNRRLSDLVTGGAAPFRSARVGSGDKLHDTFEVNATATGETQDWEPMLAGLIGEIARAADHGFSQAELDLSRRDLLAAADWSVRTEGSQDSARLVASLAAAVDTDSPILSPAQRQDRLRRTLEGLTVEDLRRAFAADFRTADYAYLLILPPATPGRPLPADRDVLAAARADWDRQTATRPADAAGAADLLAAEPTPGRVASRQADADLGLTTVVFENGVVLHHKFNDYRKDQVLVQVTLPGGVLEETAADRGISDVAALILARPATGRLSSLQIRDLMAGKNVDVSGGIGLDALSVRVQGSPADLPAGLRLVHALLTDGRLEQPAVDAWKGAQLQSIRGRGRQPGAQEGDALSATVLGGDPRLTALTAADVDRQQRGPAQAWFHRIAGHAAVEVSVVGDIPVDQAIGRVATYLGSLPKRTGSFADLDPFRHLAREPGPYARTAHYESVEPKALVTAGFLGCDEADPNRRPLSLASLVLTDRLVRRARFEEQLVYSIACRSQPGRGIPGIGLLSASAPTDPRNADRLADTILGLVKTFAASGPTDDELATAKRQMANQLAVQMRSPAYWLSQTAEMRYRGLRLADLKDVPGIYQTYSADQLRDAVRRCATPERLVRIEVLPDVDAGPLGPTTRTNEGAPGESR